MTNSVPAPQLSQPPIHNGGLSPRASFKYFWGSVPLTKLLILLGVCPLFLAMGAVDVQAESRILFTRQQRFDGNLKNREA